MPRIPRPHLPLATVFTLLACTATWGANLYPAPKVSPAAPPPHSVKPVAARVLRVGPAQAFSSIAAAATQAKDGDTVEIDAGTYVADVATWRQNRLTLRGVGGIVKLIAAGQSAQGKAIWVIAGGQVLVENIHFSGAKVADRNGAGIRFESGQLTVKNCAFTDNQNGILTANDPHSELVIENSEFGYNGYGDGQSHNLYAGHIKKLTVTGSYFHHAKVGHLLKSRAAENHIFYNRLTDETGGSASYELEFPNGGLAYVVGNTIQQSSTTQNPTIVSYGAEGYTSAINQLYLTYNTLVDDAPKGGFFLRYQPGLQRLLAVNNVLVGDGPLDGGLKRWGVELIERMVSKKAASAPTVAPASDVQTDHNITTGWSSFVQASRFDYRPKDGAFTQFTPIKLPPINGIALEPTRAYVHPMGTRQLKPGPLLPGALQPS